MQVNEKTIEKKILDYADNFLYRDLVLVKLNNVGVWDVKRNCYRKPNSIHIKKGLPDITGTINGGRGIWIEVKTPKTIVPILKHEKAVLVGGKFPSSITETIVCQIRLLHEFRKRGALAFFTDGVDNFLKTLREHGVLKNSEGSLF